MKHLIENLGLLLERQVLDCLVRAIFPADFGLRSPTWMLLYTKPITLTLTSVFTVT